MPRQVQSKYGQVWGVCQAHLEDGLGGSGEEQLYIKASFWADGLPESTASKF